MTNTLRLTNSETYTWRRCRRKWWLSYHRGLQRPDHGATGPLSIGNFVHDSLAAYYSPTDSRDPVVVLSAAVAEKVETFPILTTIIEKEATLARIMLEGYMQWLEESGADQDLHIIEAEKKLEVEIAPGVNLLTKIDARVQRISTGTRMALEHKTAQSIDSNPEVPLLQINSQLLTEHLVEFLKLKESGQEGTRAQGVLYNMLKKVKRSTRAKPPFYGREEVMHSTEELRSHWRHVLAYARQIQQAKAELNTGGDHHTIVPPSPDRSCSWQCEFLRVCPLFDDGSDAEGMLEEYYEIGDPLERYVGVEEGE